MSDQTPKDVASARAELTTARLCVNDWHTCNDHDELARWRQAQLRLIAAAQAYERVTLQEQISTLTARCEALEQEKVDERTARNRAFNNWQAAESRCEALTAERDTVQSLADERADLMTQLAELSNTYLARCQHLEQENTQLRAAQQADQERFERDLSNFSAGYSQAVTDATQVKP